MQVAEQRDRALSLSGLRAKFVAAFAIQAALIALTILLVQQWLVRRAMIEQTLEQGRAIATSVESTAGYYVLFGLTDDLKNIIGDLKRNPSIQYADFVSGEGKILAATAPAPPEASP